MLEWLFSNYKYDFVTAGRYATFTAKEKLKYHKYKNELAEQLPYKEPLSFVMDRLFNELYIKKKKGENIDCKFDIQEHFLSMFIKLGAERKELIWERSCGDIVILSSSFDRGIGSTVSIRNGNYDSIGFMVGEGNVIQWQGIQNKAIGTFIIEELYREERRLNNGL